MAEKRAKQALVNVEENKANEVSPSASRGAERRDEWEDLIRGTRGGAHEAGKSQLDETKPS